MRLSESLKFEILKSAKKNFGVDPVYLFGSRTDDKKKGGDIDLAVENNDMKVIFNKKKIIFLADIERRGIEYPFDIVQYNENTSSLLKSEIEDSGILLK